MKIATLIAILLCLPNMILGKVNFFQGSLNEVQRAAALEGKLYFIDFYAAYCLPCKLMDQTTFMDAELGEYVKENYLPLKLNVDAFDAYEVRNKHEVKALPTVMIFSSSGELLESYEGSLTASKLRGMLEKHNIPKNRQKTTPPLVESMYADEAAIEIPKKTTAANVTSRKPEIKKEPEVAKPNTEPKPIAKIVKPNTKMTTPAPTITNNQTPKVEEKPIPTVKMKIIPKPTLSKPTLPIETPKPNVAVLAPPQKPLQQVPKPKATGLYEFTVTPHPTKGFVIQIGIFAEYSNVLNEVERVQKLFPDRKVIVHIDEINDKTVYRVAVGTFTSSAAARTFMPKIKMEGFEGFVKDLSTLK